MISDEVINENDGVYSIQILLEKTICLLSVLIIALIINKVVEISCFLFAFILIRRFADGYHCESFWSCYITSLLMIFSSLPISASLKMNTSFCQGGVILSMIFIILIGNINHPNMSLTDSEYVGLVNKSRLVTFVIGSLSLILSKIDILSRISIFFQLGVIYAALGMMIAILKEEGGMKRWIKKRLKKLF